MPMPTVISRYSLLLGALCAPTVGWLSLSVSLPAQAQQLAQEAASVAPVASATSASIAPAVIPTPKAILPTTSGLRWQDLSPSQRSILSPLATMWDSLEDARKKKWLAVAQNYPQRTPAEQKNIQSRMAEWAALPRAERESARLNFSETKKLPPEQRSAEWEAYQKLSPEEKKALAEKGNTRPIGAATPIKSASAPKLTAVPITRHTPAQEKEALQGKPRINPHTLLPIPPAPPVSAPAKGATP